MKRYFIVFLCFIVVFASIPVGAAASSFEPVTDNFTSLLDLNETDKRFYYANREDISVSFNIGSESIYFSYIELLVYSYGTIESVTINGKSTTVYRDGRHMRIVCDTNFSASGTLNVVFHLTSTDGWVYFLSADYNSTTTTSKVVSCWVDCIDDPFNKDHVFYTGEYTGTPLNIYYATYTSFKDLAIHFYVNDFQFYDYINLDLFFNIGSLGSFTCKIGDIVVPFTTSVVENGDYEEFSDTYYDAPEDMFDYYLQVCIDLRDISLPPSGSILDFCILGSTDRGEVPAGSDTWFLIVNGVHGYTISDPVNPVIFWFRKLFFKLDDIFTGGSDDQSNANSFNNSVEDQASQFEDMSNTMNQVERPDINSIDLSTDSMVDSSSVILATRGFGFILDNPIILRIVLMSLTLALAGFALYGKR